MAEDMVTVDVIPAGCGMQLDRQQHLVRFRAVAPGLTVAVQTPWGLELQAQPMAGEWTGWFDLMETDLPIRLEWRLLWPPGTAPGLPPEPDTDPADELFGGKSGS